MDRIECWPSGRQAMKKVAIVGVEGSGKTVLMAVMGDKYETRDANGVFLKPVDRKTYSYYTKEMGKLREGKWPLATESIVLELEWMLMRQRKPYAAQEELGLLSFLDFGGEIYRFAFGDKAQDELDALEGQRKSAVERLRTHVENADALIVLVNLSDIINGKVNDERTIEMNWLSQAILSFAYEKSKKKNVALVFTQADTYAETIAQCGGPRGTLAKYLRVVNSNYGNKLTLFEVAAVDKTVPSRDGLGIPMPAPNFKPKGLEDLLGWIVKGVEPQRKSHNGLFAFGVLLIGCVAAYIGYNANAGFKKYVDKQLVSMGWTQEEKASGHEEPQSVEQPITKLPPVKVQGKLPVEPPKTPKPPEQKWVVGVRNPNNPHLVADQSRNTWKATRPGYVWIKGTDRDEWKQGLRHPDNYKLISDWREGEWKSTEEGYVWTGDSRTEWRAGIESTKHPHWVSIITDEHPTGYWRPKPGYSKKDTGAAGLSELVWTPGLMDGGRKAGSREGEWLKECDRCRGGYVECAICDGTGKRSESCSRCNNGYLLYTGTKACPDCNYSGVSMGMKSKRCPNNCGRGWDGNWYVKCERNDYARWPNGRHGFLRNSGSFVPCPDCGGNGARWCLSGLHDDNGNIMVSCETCRGTGMISTTQKVKCPVCDDNGRVQVDCSNCNYGKVKCRNCNNGWVLE